MGRTLVIYATFHDDFLPTSAGRNGIWNRVTKAVTRRHALKVDSIFENRRCLKLITKWSIGVSQTRHIVSSCYAILGCRVWWCDDISLAREWCIRRRTNVVARWPDRVKMIGGQGVLVDFLRILSGCHWQPEAREITPNRGKTRQLKTRLWWAFYTENTVFFDALGLV